MHVLIIEDEPLISMLIEDALSEVGYTSFDVARDQKGAIDAAALQRPDLITADQRLVSGTGVEAVRAICADVAIPVVFVAAQPHDIDLPKAVILLKPFRPQELYRAIPRAMAEAKSYPQIVTPTLPR